MRCVQNSRAKERVWLYELYKIKPTLLAGGGKIGVPVEDVSPELWRAQFALNLDSVFYLTQVLRAAHFACLVEMLSHACA